MTTITNYDELIAEKKRLQTATKFQEASFQASIQGVRERFWPVRTFLGNTRDTLTSGKGETSFLRHTLQVGIPLVIDRLFLGTKGVIAKQIITWVSKSALKRFSGNISPELEVKALNVIRIFQQNNLFAAVMRVLRRRTS